MKLSLKPFLLLTLVLSHCFSSYAVVKTHDWQNSHRGYSITLVPGTGENGVPEEFVAAGTVYDPSQSSRPGWHFMHLDNSGSIISERTSWTVSSLAHSFRVVNVVAEDPNKYWITIQARNETPGFEKDYIYVAGVDLAGNDLPMNPALYITNSGPYIHPENMYPTHSYFANGALYICGYAAAETAYPNSPDKYYSNKVCFFAKCDVNALTPTTTMTVWNSYDNLSPNDYDMPLRIAPYGYDFQGNFNTFPLLVTGATNTYGWVSGVLLAKFDAAANAIDLRSALPPYSIPVDEEPLGIYGVDIRGGVFGGDGADPEGEPIYKPDVVVLFNSFDEREPDEKNWGLIRVQSSLMNYGPSVMSYVSVNDHKSWAKQFMAMHGYISGNIQQTDNHVEIVGEQYDSEPCLDHSAYGALAPSLKNVNPFTGIYHLGHWYWDYSTGFSTLPMGPYTSNKVNLSSQGTEATNMDYYQGSMTVGNALEDVTRLYTFSSVNYHYDDPTVMNPPRGRTGMIAPLGQDPASGPTNPNLLTKFIGLDGASFWERDCYDQDNNCLSERSYNFIEDHATFELVLGVPALTADAYTLFILNDIYNDIPAEEDCAGGYFKPGKTTGVENVTAGQKIKIFPNPASSVLYVNIGQRNSSSEYQLVISDILGKTVLSSKGTAEGNIAKVDLINMTSGTYIVTVVTNGNTYTEKLTVQ